MDMKNDFGRRKSAGLVGLAEVKVTPPRGTDLAGYSAWQRLSTGVHDDLHVRGLVAASGQTAVALLSVPVCGLDAATTQAIRRAGSLATGIPEQHILVHATHTHSAPYVKGDYNIFLQNQCGRCLRDAWKRRLPAKIGIGLVEVGECGRNRRYLDYGGLPVDPAVGVIKVTDLKGRLRAVIFNYACHGTCLDARNTLVTEDWPFFAIKAIKRQTRSNVMGMYLGGAAGDINPGYSAGLSAVAAEIPIRTWAEARRIGENVGTAAVASLARIHTRPIRILRTRTAFVDLPLRTTYPVTLREAKQRLRQAKQALAKIQAASHPVRTCVDRAKVNVFFAELVYQGAQEFYAGNGPRSVRAELQTMVFNDAVITTFPGEVFVNAGLAVKRRSPCAKTLVVGLANTFEAEGYLPTRESFAEGDYEVFETRYGEAAADKLVAATLKNIKVIWAGKKN